MTAIKKLINKLQTQNNNVLDNVFIGACEDIGFNRVFGGQVIAQALLSAQKTITLRHLHSLKCYFVRQGQVELPISYHVENIRDGNSFSIRQIHAKQNEQTILTMTCSFQLTQSGLQHQLQRPQLIDRSQLVSLRSCYKNIKQPLPKVLTQFIQQDNPIEFYVAADYHPLQLKVSQKSRQVWFKASNSIEADLSVHQALLAYTSDYGLLETALMPHGVSIFSRKINMASLDHSIHFHRPFHFDQWLIFICQSPSAQQGRAFVRGDIYNQQGDLIASVAQEGMIRYNNSI